MSSIYVASSWRNEFQSSVVVLLWRAGHSVYDFKNPPQVTGFSWEEVDPCWRHWSVSDYVSGLRHQRAREGFASDMNALREADACVLVQPCGTSAHLELGWAVGAGKKTCIYFPDNVLRREAELMVMMADAICVGEDALIAWAKRLSDDRA